MAIGTAYIKIMPEAKGIESTIGGVVDPAAEKAGKTGGSKWVNAFKKVLVVAGVGKAISASLFAGADLEQAIGGIETLYKDASDKMQGYASQAYKTAGIDATTYMEQATSFSAALIKSYNGDVDKAADATNQAMIDMADNANKMGTPMESIQNAYQGFAKQNYTMLDNLKLGYGGTKTEMERLLADAEKITGVHYDISNLDDVYNAIHVIQTEMGIAGTTQKEAAETISGSINMVKASYKDLIANLALGNDIYPQLEALGTSLIAMFKNVLPAIGRVIIGIPVMIWNHRGEIIAKINDLMANAWDAIIAASPMIIEKVREIFVNVVNYIAANGPKILMKILEIGANVLGYITSLLTSILAGLMLGARDIGAKVWQAIQAKINEIKTRVTTWAGGVVTSIRTKFNEIVSAITSPFTNAWNKLKGIIAKIKGIFPLKLGRIFDGIKLPHFKISGGKIPWGIGGAGKAPSVSVEWYAKGGIMAKPTLFGGGENGAEAIMPLDPFWAKMDKLVDGVNSMGGVTVNVYGTSGMDVNDLAAAVERKIIETQNRRRLAWQ